MNEIWFALLGLMLTTYVVLDGFDLGAGIVHHFVARTDEERRLVLAAIGPLWDGNEVWLIASGGTLVFAFPRAYAAAFSGFYLPLMMVLWLLVLRGCSIEFRSLEENRLWRSFWDALFCGSSTLLAVVLGASLGNLIRGVPLEGSGYFAAPLFSSFDPGGHPGALDGYTVLVGVLAATVLAGHGALYLAWKTEGAVQARSWRAAVRAWQLGAGLTVATTAATAYVDRGLMAHVAQRPWAWPFPLLAAAGLGCVFVGIRRRRELLAFGGSAAFIAGLLGATAAGLFPAILTSTIDGAFTLTASSAATGRGALARGLGWWSPALALAVGYFYFLFRSFAGKLRPAAAKADDHQGY